MKKKKDGQSSVCAVSMYANFKFIVRNERAAPRLAIFFNTYAILCFLSRLCGASIPIRYAMDMLDTRTYSNKIESHRYLVK